jgi:hypothetical protein
MLKISNTLDKPQEDAREWALAFFAVDPGVVFT